MEEIIKRSVHREVETVSRSYLVERVEVRYPPTRGIFVHYELTAKSAIGGFIFEEGVRFNNKRDADTGLLDRVCTV
jgi:hypothetical protein